MEEKIRVLVVDDDRRMVKTICDILKAKGYEAYAALSGEEAVEMVRGDIPDCVLMDVKMPGIDGIEAMKIIKKMAPGLPVVLMSANASEEQSKESRSSGSYNILPKPIDIQLLLSFLSLLRREKCILVVDDDPVFCDMLQDLLRSRHYQVDTEDNPARALGLMDDEYKLAVVLNLKLDDTEGLRLLQDIRRRYPSKPVILVTGYGSEMSNTVEMGFKIGAHSCFYKPFAMEELVGMIEKLRLNKLGSILGEAYP